MLYSNAGLTPASLNIVIDRTVCSMKLVFEQFAVFFFFFFKYSFTGLMFSVLPPY